MKFSIVIPTYNEAKDIATTLSALIKLNYQNKEIIVVDDSTDETPEIIKNNFSKDIKLIKPDVRKGRCEARNIGVRAARGEIIIILNADAILPVDFIEKIKLHYDNGYDCVTVMADVENHKTMYARYVDALSLKKEKLGVYEKRKITHNGIYWSEGFSVRKELALKANLFPVGHSVPIEAGEDVEFVNSLRSNGSKGIIDLNLRIKHTAPDNFLEFWQIRKGRGAGTPQIRRFINKWSFEKIFFIIFSKFLLRMSKIILFIPIFIHCYKLSRYSSKTSFLEIWKFMWCFSFEQLAFSVGEFKSFYIIFTRRKL